MSSMLTLRVMHRLAEGLVALRRFTGEVAALPGGVARLAKQNCAGIVMCPSHGFLGGLEEVREDDDAAHARGPQLVTHDDTSWAAAGHP